MKTKDITERINKLAKWGVDSPEDARRHYGSGIYLSDFNRFYIYNLSQIDRFEVELDNQVDEYAYNISTPERKVLIELINNKLEPLRQNVMKATQALDNYLRVAGEQAKEIIESTVQNELKTK